MLDPDRPWRHRASELPMNSKRFLVAGAFLLVLLVPVLAQIKWIESYDTAFKTAARTGQPVLVLITAPSWCGWCQKFEQQVLSDKKVQEMVSKNFVPLLVLDTNEKDLARFDFDGFPTVRVYDAKAKQLEDVYVLEPGQFLSLLKPFAGKAGASGNSGAETGAANPGSTGTPTAGTDSPANDDPLVVVTHGNAYFAKLADGRWQHCDEYGSCVSLTESDKGTNPDYWMLYGFCAPAGRKAWISVPKAGGKSYWFDDSSNKWVDLYVVNPAVQ